MNKIYLICSAALTMLLTVSAHAQLNGVYTIDNTQPASTTNFTSFTQFASTLNAQGVSGPVTANVGNTSGPYVEQVEFQQITGASAINTITINGNGRTVTFGAGVTANRHTILFTGTDYVTINNLTVTATNATNAFAVHLWSGADNNNFNNCLFTAPTAGTGTGLCPFSISGTRATAAGSGTGGNNNTVNTCTTTGGYYGVMFYASSTNNSSDNKLINSLIREFYASGVQNTYHDNTLIQGNIVERPTRAQVTATEGIYVTTGSERCVIERNHVRRLFHGNTAATNTGYGIYISADATVNNQNIIRNNIVSDFYSAGDQYGISASGAEFAIVYHNTISLDDPTASANESYGLNITASDNTVMNNLVYITRAGTGIKYGVSVSTAGSNGLTLDYNSYYVASPGGNNYVGDLNTSYATLAQWQAATGFDIYSVYDDPAFTNASAMNYVPTSTVVNNAGAPVGVLTDFNLSNRSIVTPDPGAFEFYNSPCSTTPPTATLSIASASLCPGGQFELALQSLGSFTNSGYEIQWQSSTVSALGGYAAVPGATLPVLSTGVITLTTYYQAVITCSFSSQFSTTSPASLIVLPGTVSNVPYFESFETLVVNGLPNCSWSATNYKNVTFTGQTPQTGNRIARSGNGYAYFHNTPAGTNYFFTNPINMTANVTYSAALWYITNNIDYNEWADLSILVGSSPNAAAMVQVATIAPVSGNLYNLLTNTFTIPSSGQYYVAIRATTAPGAAPYLTWDDLSITIPCSLNAPELSLFTSTNSICPGQSAILSATGADTYSWSNGSTGSQISVSPASNTLFTVTGYNTASGCFTTQSSFITVRPAPQLAAFASNPSICAGQTTTLSASGADSYYWTAGFSGQTGTTAPVATEVFTVSAVNNQGCPGTATVLVTVNSTPSLQVSASASTACAGDLITMQALGALNYTWTAPQLFVQGSQVTVTPQSSTNYQITGIDQNGCVGRSSIILDITACTGIAENDQTGKLRIFPNPATSSIIIEGKAGHSIRITDVAGRTIYTSGSIDNVETVQLGTFAKGVYYVELKEKSETTVLKFIKD